MSKNRSPRSENKKFNLIWLWLPKTIIGPNKQ